MFTSPFAFAEQAVAYCADATQRQILFLATQHQRSENFCEGNTQEQPDVLFFDTELILDGRTFDPPVNYKLERVVPKEAHPKTADKRPVIVFDPRAAQGSGMAGMKDISQLGKSLEEGHPTYYVSFFTNPEEGQTIERVCEVCVEFVRIVKDKHPDAQSPFLIGNCQAGWQLAIMNAAYPELDCPLVLAAAPLSYWAGAHGQNPMRYTSGMLGGSWLTAMAADCGGGLFDSANMIESFENNSPSISYLKKPHHLYANIDTEEDRYLDFEKWWNSPIYFRKEEILFIIERLFIGNDLVKGNIELEDGRKADLRNIKKPVFILCSHGDVITPPSQALSWVLDCYKTDKELEECGQTIVYCIKDEEGHLGLITAQAIIHDTYHKLFNDDDRMEKLAPGLYEAVGSKDQDSFTYVKRNLDQLRELCPRDSDDDARFKQVEDLSKSMKEAYETTMAPLIQSTMTKELAEQYHASQAVRSRLTAMSSENPMMAALPALAEWVKENRVESSKDTVFWEAQEELAKQMAEQIDDINLQKEASVDAIFSAFYGMPWLK